SHDHLDYHKNMQSYFNSKLYLFRRLLKKNSKIITDEDNQEFKIIKKIANKREIKKITIGSNSGNIKILNNKYKQNKQHIKISINSKIFKLEVPLIGYFQIKNLFMAVLAALTCGLNQNRIFTQIHKIKAVPGRLECVANLNNNSNIIVDFAHTPDALEQSLVALEKQFKKKIVIVFGCGGERDKKKRYAMGKIAAKYCRKIYVTDDNPRNENPKKIRNSIIKGCKKLAIDIGSRKKAIKAAIKELKSNEILLVAGKGHEETQNYGNKIINFSDKKLIKEIIQKRKFSFKKTHYHNFLLNKVFNKDKLKNINYNGVSINTKTIKKNNLFFAICGKKTDGHKFVKEAVRKGAIKSIVSKKIKKLSSNKIIKVKNTFSSLNNLAKVTRDNSSAQIVGITGSVGKTTLKNLLSFSLKNYGKVYSSPHSYNNKFGVPLSLSNLKSNIDYGVFEIGMDKKGEIDNLSKIVKPEIAIITNISGAHFKNFNTLKDIAKAVKPRACSGAVGPGSSRLRVINLLRF
ncbi:MAG TPA: UDP-N-acetylmuramyl-tripeptide synthetase, partial [Pelagibacterales bacterium]|nr:UDP-N-acetylmuramyl-tripeptide synthetase [Pelagibacterales bacterium]